MHFVDLKRNFAPIAKDQEVNLYIDRTLGRGIANWLNWPDLLERRRIVLLAEASSGKTEEFSHQAEALRTQGKAAFFVRIEDLADEGFEAALEPTAGQDFERWRNGDEEGWFLLDSIDEARLNHKSLERALRHFAGELDRGLERARIYVSCRVSDWKGPEDWNAVERLLPAWEKPALPHQQDDDAPLLEPIFDNPRKSHTAFLATEPERKLNALLVVQLLPLTAEQQRKLAEAAGIEPPDDFVAAIERNGLEALADRPGDLLHLAEYWKTEGRFGTLAAMTGHGVTRKLAERDAFRPDNNDLSTGKARDGAERLAAALTLGKSFTLRASGHDPDPTLAAGALDPVLVLDDWTDAERNALMRRGVFAPSTYGRLKFHQRGTQEYLTAKWLDRLLRAGCPRDVVWELIFAERYGIETLVPSFHATAAWLALDYPDIRDEIIRREPLVLLRHGDPRSLPVDVKERLLLTYATHHVAGEISNDSLDHRALWMFATPALADAIRRSWAVNNREDFRIDLLRLIREGAIDGCIDLARGAVIDESAGEYLRIVAVQALDTCKDTVGLAAAAQSLMGRSDPVGRRLAAGFAKLLFPRYLSIDGLLALIRRSKPMRPDALEGFGDQVGDFWKACPDTAVQEQLMAGLADLCLAPPFVADHTRIAARYQDLAKKLAPLAREAVLGLGDAEPSEGLVRLLIVVERADRYRWDDQETPPLGALVSRNATLQRRLFWADVEETRQNESRGQNHPTQIWHVHIRGGPLWQLGSEDLVWLFEDLSRRVLAADRQIALSAILNVLRSTGGLATESSRLQSLIAGQTELQKDLQSYLVPQIEDEQSRRYREDELRDQHARDQQEREAKEWWRTFRDELKANPSVLCDPVRLTDWATGALRLYRLTHWLCNKTKKDELVAAREWRLLEEGFGRSVAEAYRDGMKVIWRVTLPERPKHRKGASSVSNATILSFAGLGVEAAEDHGWASRLTAAEAARAAQHACLSERGYPDWVEVLVDRHTAIVLPIVRKAFQYEWSGRHPCGSDFLSHYAWANKVIQPSVQAILYETVKGKEAKANETLARGLLILRRLDLNGRQRSQAVSLAVRRLRHAQAAGNDERVRHYLANLLLVDANRATREISAWIDGAPEASHDTRAETSLGALFGRDSPLTANTFDQLSVVSVETLIRIAYRYIRPEEDRGREGNCRTDERDNAECARRQLLHVLLKRSGGDAYRAMRALASEGVIRANGMHFSELAHGKAEQDAEPAPWTPKEVLTFERRHVAPAKTGDALLRVVVGVLSDIQSSFHYADATSRPLVERADGEDKLQGWLTEQMNFRAKGRFSAYRETHVALGDKPDIIVSSTASQVEVAVEVKHGGKGWSVRKLERALTGQLARNYLKSPTRRRGVLVVSHHGRRTWRDPDNRKTLKFAEMIQRLQNVASKIVTNEFGSIEVRVFGIDASAPAKRSTRVRGPIAIMV